jgi:alkylhydroperoxidase family enzyme
VILRVAHLSGSDYELDHHERIGARVGLTPAEIARVAQGPGAAGWTERRAAILKATDELHEHRCIGDDTWDLLRDHLDERELIELCMLAGHYEMLAGTLNSLGVALDARRG